MATILEAEMMEERCLRVLPPRPPEAGKLLLLSSS